MPRGITAPPRSSPARTRTPPTAIPGRTSSGAPAAWSGCCTALGVEPQDRVGTLAWNGYRHLEVYYAASGMQAICHTINPRLHPDDITYIINHAQDKVLFVDVSFASLISAIAPHIAGSVRTVVMLTDAANMPEVTLAPGMTLACYDQLMDAADEDYTWPMFDENTASALCYTSGTTGRPKGVLYSHRSTSCTPMRRRCRMC